MSSILVVAEQKSGALKRATLSAITFAQQAAARLGAEVHVLVLGDAIGGAVEEVRKYGAAKVWRGESASLGAYIAQAYAVVAADVAKQAGAVVVVSAATSYGKDLLPRVAARLGAGMASDVSRLTGEGADLQFVRPVFAGNLLATVAIDSAVKVVTVRATEFRAAEAVAGAALSPVADVAAASAPTARSASFVSFEEAKSDRPELTGARVVVAGGRGTKSPEGYKETVERLADSLGAAVGASRAICDAGWVPNDWQVGQTGKVVAPDLYFALGISGAIQHVAGMRGSKVIVSINKDPEAPIFNISDYGLVADVFKAVPELIDELKKVRA